MITKEELDQLILDESKKKTGAGSLKKSASNKIRFYRECKMYLETGPIEESLQEWLEKAESTVRSLSDRFGQWMSNNPDRLMKNAADNRRAFEVESGIDALSKRIKTVKLILKK